MRALCKSGYMVMIGVLLFLSVLRRATSDVGTTNIEVHATAPTVVEVQVGKSEAESSAWQAFLRENLEPDLAYWRARAPLKADDIWTSYNATLKEKYIPAVIQLVLIFNNKLYWVYRPDPNGGDPTNTWASGYNTAFHKRVTAALANGRLQLPNMVFVYNTDDNAPRFNGPHRNPRVPFISIIKSKGLPWGDDLDILVPQMFMMQNTMSFLPWQDKKDKAFFRGIGFCSWQWMRRYNFTDACPRLYLSYLSYRDQQASNNTVLDVGIVEPHDSWGDVPERSIRVQLPVLPRVPIAEHARYKWLLHLEGITASNRLGQLFMINSVVLFQRSPYIEYFYRSLTPWKQYVPFWNATDSEGRLLGMDDVYDTIRQLRQLDQSEPEVLQGVVAAANKFAATFLTLPARLRYLQAALLSYRELFPDMDQTVEAVVADMRRRGWNI